LGISNPDHRAKILTAVELLHDYDCMLLWNFIYAWQAVDIFLISDFCHVLNIMCFLMGDSLVTVV
jgi:hypothetical protein